MEPGRYGGSRDEAAVRSDSPLARFAATHTLALRREARFALLAAALLSTGCPPAAEGLTVDVKTDFAPGEHFASVRSELSTDRFPDALVTGLVVTIPAGADDAFLTGVRVAEHAELAAGTYFVRVSLVTAGGGVLASRTTEVRVTGRYALTTILSRSCEGVSCPGSGDPQRSECSGGVCVEPACSPELPEACPAPACLRDGDCAPPTGCGVARCVAGVCLLARDDARCAAGERCRAADLTCAPASDAGPSDAGPSDAGLERDAPAADAPPADAPLVDAAYVCTGTCPAHTVCAPGNRCVCADLQHGDCNRDLGTMTSDGCEADLATDPENCGGCLYDPCTDEHVDVGTCAGGTCAIGTCDPGFLDCDLDVRNGCETPLGTTRDCSACSDSCAGLPGMTDGTCVSNACVPGPCMPGRLDCTAEPGCETDAMGDTHCGSCTNDCTDEHASGGCIGPSMCGIGRCDAGFTSCDGNSNNGCESTSITTSDCCGSVCVGGQICIEGAPQGRRLCA